MISSVEKGEEVEEGVWEFVFVDGTKRRLKVRNIEGPIFRGIDEEACEEFQLDVLAGRMWKVFSDRILIKK